ncbi:MAG TPA: lipopolysaccharide biosynthesis protein, partial [Anaeromyxobacter sp.]|nr:lipopolysaccharide biosynthesis protein [Anaeromyxobacter sp.]
AWELIHRRENLIELVKEAELLEAPGKAPGQGLKELTSRLTDARRPQEDPLDAMVLRVERALVVTSDEGTINITFDWPDPQQAYRVVEGALQNFIEARHVQEVTAIDEVISVLRARAATAKDKLDRVVEDVRREGASDVRDTAVAAGAATTRPAGARGPSEELVRLKSLLDAKQRAIEDVEEFRRRRLADLQAQLDEKRNTLSEAHPQVIQLRRDIEALSRESPQIASLREDEQKLRKDYAARAAEEARTPGAAPASAPRAQRRTGSGEEDERIRSARLEWQQMIERVNASQLELDAARAAFKYRYSVIWPAQIPKTPVSPNPVKILGMGTLAALAFALALAAAPDLLAGRITERWQVEQLLQLPVLGELTRK